MIRLDPRQEIDYSDKPGPETGIDWNKTGSDPNDARGHGDASTLHS